MSKKILVVNPAPLFPVVMASQDRVIEMIKRLSFDHEVSLATLVRTKDDVRLTKSNLKDYINSFYPVKAINSNLLSRILTAIFFRIQYPILGYSQRFFYWGNRLIIKRFCKIIDRNEFDIIQVEHWYQARLLNKVNRKTLKVISSHDLLYEKKELELKKRFGDNIPLMKKREFSMYRKQEIKYYNSADVVIAISKIDYDKIAKVVNKKSLIIIPIGKDLIVNNYYYQPNKKTILFYGSMGGEQNVIAFFRFWHKILPIVRKSLPEVKVKIVGANPPSKILNLHDGESVIVTGFAENLTSAFDEVTVMVVPLETGGGFRGRVIDVMSFGIPVIGTHNALDCINMEQGKQGHISDNDLVLASELVNILNSPSKASQMSKESKKFVVDKYSIEATYGKLSNFYLEYEIN